MPARRRYRATMIGMGVLAALVVLAAVCLVVFLNSADAPARESFYDPPSPLPAGP